MDTAAGERGSSAGARVVAEEVACCLASGAPYGGEMGLAAGGRMRQEIYPDPHGLETWDPENTGRVYVHIVNSTTFRDITGMEPPPSPVSARTYTDYGLPWFDLYAEGKGDVAPSATLAGVTSVKETDHELGVAPQQDDAMVPVPAGQVVALGGDAGDVADGEW